MHGGKLCEWCGSRWACVYALLRWARLQRCAGSAGDELGRRWRSLALYWVGGGAARTAGAGQELVVKIDDGTRHGRLVKIDDGARHGRHLVQ